MKKNPASISDLPQDQNDDQFRTILKEIFPDLFFLVNLMEKDNITTTDAMEILHKVAMVRRLDDGYGKVLVECRDGNITRVRLLADKVLRPYGSEKEFDI